MDTASAKRTLQTWVTEGEYRYTAWVDRHRVEHKREIWLHPGEEGWRQSHEGGVLEKREECEPALYSRAQPGSAVPLFMQWDSLAFKVRSLHTWLGGNKSQSFPLW